MEDTINLKELLGTIKKRISLILSVTLITIILSAFITFFILTPKYEASTQILVNQSQNNNEELSSTDLQSSRELISTYNVIMTSPAILEPVIERSNFNGSIGDLRSKINVEAEEESQVATVTIEDESPQVAVNLVNTLAQTFEEEISNIMDVDNVSILAEAQIEDSNSPVSPQPILNLFVGFIIGALLGFGLAFLLEYLDKSIKNENDIEKELEIPILGVVPEINEKEFSKNENINSNIRAKSRGVERKTS